MARKPSTRKRREPAPAASTRAEPAASNKRPTTKPGAACLERVLTRDATHFNLVAQLVEWCGCADPLCAFEATSKTCAEAARTPVKLALTTATEAQPLTSLVRSHASRRKLSMAAAGRRLVVIEAVDGAHANVALERPRAGSTGRRPRPRACASWRRAPRTRWPTAACSFSTRRSSARRRGRGAWSGASPSRPRPSRRPTATACSTRSPPAWALDEMGPADGKRWTSPCQALDLILAVGAAAADVEDGRMTLEAVRRACAAAPRSAAASRQDPCARARTPRVVRAGAARPGPPFAAAGDDTIEVAHPRCSRRSSRKRRRGAAGGPQGLLRVVAVAEALVSLTAALRVRSGCAGGARQVPGRAGGGREQCINQMSRRFRMTSTPSTRREH